MRDPPPRARGAPSVMFCCKITGAFCLFGVLCVPCTRTLCPLCALCMLPPPPPPRVDVCTFPHPQPWPKRWQLGGWNGWNGSVSKRVSTTPEAPSSGQVQMATGGRCVFQGDAPTSARATSAARSVPSSSPRRRWQTEAQTCGLGTGGLWRVCGSRFLRGPARMAATSAHIRTCARVLRVAGALFLGGDGAVQAAAVGADTAASCTVSPQPRPGA